MRSVAVPETMWAALATVCFGVGGLAQLLGAPDAMWWTAYAACYLAGGWEPALAGLQALRERTLDVDILMIVAALIAASIGQVFDGALLIVIFSTSGALEAVATKRTEDSVSALLDLAPERATRLDDDGRQREVPAADLVVGDRVLVRPGERIGADGVVRDGLSDVDQASITGEPLPVTRGVGDEVFAGTLNGVGALTVEVTRAAHDSVVARIVAQVERASATKATTQLFIERVEQRYSVGVVAATLALFVVPLLLGAAVEPTLLRAMTFMIVASPCAVVLATMPPLLATIANAGRHGVLVKSAVALEELSRVDVVAFDKTGTLTHGTPRVAAVVATAAPVTASAAWAPAPDETAVLRLAAAAERDSQHPVGRAVVEAAAERGLAAAPSSAFVSVPGRGVSAVVEGRVVRVESPAALAPDTLGPARTTVAELEATGHTVVVVTVDDVVVGLVALADRVRSGAAAAAAALEHLTGSSPLLLTGDNEQAAQGVARSVGIEQVRAGLLPADKVSAVEELRDAGRRVLLVGDGVNDAPAMATARVGVAMGRRGSDLALETADVVLVRDELGELAASMRLARRAQRVVRANLVLAATVITALVVWDVVGTLPLPLGVAGHEGSTIVVALNGLRLLRRRAWSTGS